MDALIQDIRQHVQEGREIVQANVEAAPANDATAMLIDVPPPENRRGNLAKAVVAPEDGLGDTGENLPQAQPVHGANSDSDSSDGDSDSDDSRRNRQRQVRFGDAHSGSTDDLTSVDSFHSL